MYYSIVVALVAALAVPALSQPSEYCVGTRKSPSPNYCGVTLPFTKKPKLYQTTRNSSLNSCESGCFTDTKCKSFGFENATSTCYYYLKPVNANSFPLSGKDNVLYYNRACFNIECACSYAVSPQVVQYNGNELVNPSFEQGSFGWNAPNGGVNFTTSTCSSNAYPYDFRGFARMTASFSSTEFNPVTVSQNWYPSGMNNYTTHTFNWTGKYRLTSLNGTTKALECYLIFNLYANGGTPNEDGFAYTTSDLGGYTGLQIGTSYTGAFKGAIVELDLSCGKGVTQAIVDVDSWDLTYTPS